MTQNLDKNKLKELIQRASKKDILYLHINPVETKSLENALRELQKFIGKNFIEIIMIKK